MKRKTIGIPGYKDAKGESFGGGINHLQFIHRFGDVRIIMPWEGYVKVDMLYLPGGLDTQPARYGEIPGFNTSNQDVFKEFFFENRLSTYIKKNTPIFGVCLGAQMLAVYFGAKLTQDLIFHETSSDRWKTAHTVYPMYEMVINGKKCVPFSVNSHHHQGLGLNATDGTDIEPMLRTPNNDEHITGEKYIVEAFAVKDKPIYGVQWHPEELYDKFSMALINELLTNKI